MLPTSGMVVRPDCSAAAPCDLRETRAAFILLLSIELHHATAHFSGIEPCDTQFGSGTQHSVHLVTFSKSLNEHNRDRVVWRVKMLCDAHPELLTLKRGDLHFEIITARIHHRNMFTNFKAQSLHMVAILRIDPQKKGRVYLASDRFVGAKELMERHSRILRIECVA